MYLSIPAARIRFEMEKMDVHPVGIELMAPKADVQPLKLFRVRTPAANIIKQEMLALDGDCVTPRDVVNGALAEADIILLGNVRQYRLLIKKLATMANWFGIQKVMDDLCRSRNR